MDFNVWVKYLNFFEMFLFDKGCNLYNVGLVWVVVVKGKLLIVVEGYMDVIVLVCVGFEGVVVFLGMVIIEDQLCLMWCILFELVIVLDGDMVGLWVVMWLIDLGLFLIVLGQVLCFVFLFEGQDFDDLICVKGVLVMFEVLEQLWFLVDLLWKCEIEGWVFDSFECKVVLDKVLGDVIVKIVDKDMWDYYFQMLKNLKWELFSLCRCDLQFCVV